MVSAYRGKILDGVVHIIEGESLPEGADVIVVVVSEDAKGITGQEVLDSDLIGIWADRDDIQDSAEFARKLREKAQRRE